MNDVVNEHLCFTLSKQAERARWELEDLPWDRLDPERAPESLRVLVREIAFSELTTTTATQRFLTEFADDTDFTQWLSVWFFEETRHPQVLLRWLRQLGVSVDDRFLRRGRATAPFMKSRFGTLVANVISEIVASSSYASLYANAGEPVLAAIAKNLAADEARHSAGFYAYAQRFLETSKQPDVDRRDAIKVAYSWFHGDVRHPVSELHARNDVALRADPTVVRGRALNAIGSLVGIPLDATSDLLAHVRDLGDRQEGAQR